MNFFTGSTGIATGILCAILLNTGALQAQNNGNNGNNGNEVSVSISVSATVETGTDVTMVTLRDMNLDRQVTRQGIIMVDPQIDEQAGKMRAEGRAYADVRISFLEERELTRIGGPEQLTFYYEVAGNDIDDQTSAEILELDNRDFQLNEDGEFYFWIGGQVDIRNAVQGAYDGEFTVEIEYL